MGKNVQNCIPSRCVGIITFFTWICRTRKMQTQLLATFTLAASAFHSITLQTVGRKVELRGGIYCFAKDKPTTWNLHRRQSYNVLKMLKNKATLWSALCAPCSVSKINLKFALDTTLEMHHSGCYWMIYGFMNTPAFIQHILDHWTYCTKSTSKCTREISNGHYVTVAADLDHG